jgi:hypothetical protein
MSVDTLLMDISALVLHQETMLIDRSTLLLLSPAMLLAGFALV